MRCVQSGYVVEREASCVTRKVCTHSTIVMLSDERDRVMFEVVEFGVDRDEGWEIDGSRSALARFDVRRLERKIAKVCLSASELLFLLRWLQDLE